MTTRWRLGENGGMTRLSKRFELRSNPDEANDIKYSLCLGKTEQLVRTCHTATFFSPRKMDALPNSSAYGYLGDEQDDSAIAQARQPEITRRSSGFPRLPKQDA